MTSESQLMVLFVCLLGFCIFKVPTARMSTLLKGGLNLKRHTEVIFFPSKGGVLCGMRKFQII